MLLLILGPHVVGGVGASFVLGLCGVVYKAWLLSRRP